MENHSRPFCSKKFPAISALYGYNQKCHAPTLSQARDNRHVNPSGVINTFFELAQGFQTPVHTYNPYITGEYQIKFENNTKDVYIYRKGSRVYKYTAQRIHSIQ